MRCYRDTGQIADFGTTWPAVVTPVSNPSLLLGSACHADATHVGGSGPSPTGVLFENKIELLALAQRVELSRFHCRVMEENLRVIFLADEAKAAVADQAYN